ncbi:MAG TPA: hypothetical protein VFE91_02985, partial [Nitrososphaerales archaeon]|nr:hypothetical protein [Nitrososphaerales archaeon]
MTNKTSVIFISTLSILILGIAAGATFLSNRPQSGGNLTTCTINVEGNLDLRIVNSSNGNPIPGAQVEVSNLYPICPPNPHTTAVVGILTTDSNGSISVGGLGE